MRIGTHEFNVTENTYIMGILNVTPDSFSDGGKYHGVDVALKRAEQMMHEGAAILDIGGESTRPGFIPVSEEEEMERILPVVEAVKQRLDIPISVDTYKSIVAEAAIQVGADLINDIWGLKADACMAELIAKKDVACCLMHNRSNTDYVNFMDDVIVDLKECLVIADGAGIPRDKIMLDPGVGFAKSYEQNLEVLRNLGEIKTLGYPVLLGASRKSVIGLTLDLPSEERLEGTIVTTVAAVQQGCGFVRVHDVKENYRAIQMAQAIYRRG
ncbi:MAG: dihydropteroate synthase [Agathobacter sp.]|nr:dihydropteroate synthase [Agathobacter sp.]